MGCRRSPFLNMGTTLAVVQSIGIVPCFNEAWKNSVNAGVSSSASVLSNLVGTGLKSQVVSLQTAHSWAKAGVMLGDACIGSGVAFEELNYWDEVSERKVKVN